MNVGHWQLLTQAVGRDSFYGWRNKCSQIAHLLDVYISLGQDIPVEVARGLIFSTCLISEEMRMW